MNLNLYLSNRTSVACSAGKNGDVLPVDIASEKAVKAAITNARRQTVSLIQAHGRILSE